MKKTIIPLCLFVVSFTSFASTSYFYNIERNSPVVLGSVENGDIVKLNGVARFYKKDITQEKKEFVWSNNGENQVCNAIINILSPEITIPYRSVSPRLNIIVGDRKTNINGFENTKWEDDGEQIKFKTKFRIKFDNFRSLPLSVVIENSPSAQYIPVGYIGNDCDAPVTEIPGPISTSAGTYLSQDYQEYSIEYTK